ncbi:MAG: Gfo/Idh/MocA family oxidoreductase [Chloroflexota bacterium]|nr:Gfo/Idh/MocA family oxidoreductase [Chloroflexota bacterium]
MNKLSAVLIGTGDIARSHAEAVHALAERVELVAAMDIHADRAAAFCTSHAIPRAYADMGEMLRVEQPDLVLIASPPAVHAEQCIAALEAGAWVLCEKPLCASLAELDAIQAAEARTGRSVSVVFQRRFGAGAQHVRSLIASGALGKAMVALGNTTWYRAPAYYAVPWRGRWATEVGGATVSLGIHLIDLVLSLIGDWREVRALITTLDRAIEVENCSSISVLFESGAVGSFLTSAVSPREHTSLRLDFERATVELDFLYHYTNADWRFSAGASPDAALLPPDWQHIPTETAPSHATQLAQVLDAMATNTRPPVSGDDARRTLELIAGAYKSAFTGRPVQRGEITPGDPFYAAMNGGTP